jgi:N-formylglutamate deformylase
MAAPFLLHLPTSEAVPILANLPHSGLLMPPEMTEQLEPAYQRYLPNQDWHLDKLYSFLPSLGITTLQATYSRYVVDLNRSPKEPQFGSFWQSVVAEKTAFNETIYSSPPSPVEIQQRIEQYYYPYHAQLQTLLLQMIEKFGKVYLLDLHSFLGLIEDEICLGNCNGLTCSDRFMRIVEEAFLSQGYQTVCNKVFRGGYITQHYGQHPSVEALQIEVRYPVYLETNQLDQAFVPDWNVPKLDIASHKFKLIMRQVIACSNSI